MQFSGAYSYPKQRPLKRHISASRCVVEVGTGFFLSTEKGPAGKCPTLGKVGVGVYLYGFNGQEKVDEIAGVGNHLNFDARGYDPRLGRFWATDPLGQKFPGQSTYSFAGDNPILMIDKNGEVKTVYNVVINQATGKTAISKVTSSGLMSERRTDMWGNRSYDWYDYTEVKTTVIDKSGRLISSPSAVTRGAFRTSTWFNLEGYARSKVNDDASKETDRDGIIFTTKSPLFAGNDGGKYNAKGRGEFVNLDQIVAAFGVTGFSGGASRGTTFAEALKYLRDGALAADAVQQNGAAPIDLSVSPEAASPRLDTICTSCGGKNSQSNHGFKRVLTDKNTGDTVGTLPATAP